MIRWQRSTHLCWPASQPASMAGKRQTWRSSRCRVVGRTSAVMNGIPSARIQLIAQVSSSQSDCEAAVRSRGSVAHCKALPPSFVAAAAHDWGTCCGSACRYSNRFCAQPRIRVAIRYVRRQLHRIISVLAVTPSGRRRPDRLPRRQARCVHR